jgi:phosphoribosylanthranilate isomerase
MMAHSTLVKICGTTSRRDAMLALDAGADFVGVVLDHAPSPRCVALSEAPQVLGDAFHGSSAALVALSRPPSAGARRDAPHRAAARR